MVAYDFLYTVATAGVIILLTALASRLMGVVIGRVFRDWIPVVRSNVQRLVSVIVWIVGILLVVEQLGLNLNILLLIFGLVGAGALVALWRTIENIGARYFSDVYIPFKVGDIVRVGDKSGKVIEINPVATILLTEKETLVSVPNYFFLKEQTENLTPHVWKEILVPITIKSNVSLPKFESEVLRESNKLRRYLDHRFPPVLTVTDKTAQSLNLVLTLIVRDPSKKNEITREIHKRISEIEDRFRGAH